MEGGCGAGGQFGKWLQIISLNISKSFMGIVQHFWKYAYLLSFQELAEKIDTTVMSVR